MSILPVTIKLTRIQSDVFWSRKRFRVVVSGRRSGKTYLALTEALMMLRDPCWQVQGKGLKYPYWAAHSSPRRAAYVAPTYRQAKDVAWTEAKDLTRPYWERAPYETELKIVLEGGHTLQLYGAEKYERMRGLGLDFCVIDEYADIHPDAWNKVIRLSLADRRGAGLFIGTPKGFNHFHDLYNRVPDLPEWSRFQFTTSEGGLVSQEELKAARLELDELTYRQELEAQFEDQISHRAYYAFGESNIVEGDFDPDYPLILCCDFNISPMSWVVCQQYGEGLGGDIVHVLEEIVVRDTNTPAQCRALDEVVERMLPGYLHQVRLRVYGDASGDRRSTSGSPSDLRIIRKHLGSSSLYRPSFHFDRSNPLQKDRVAAMNRMLADLGIPGLRQRLLIDPCCRELLRDLRQVVWHVDSKGNTTPDLGKSDPDRTHTSDALGYYVYKEFGFKADIGWKSFLRH